MHGLYPIIDVDTLQTRRVPFVPFVEALLAEKPALIQLRAKALAAGPTLELLRSLLPRCRAAGCLLFANDRPDLALLAGADGVHLGQADLPIAEARRFAPTLKIGLSTHNLEQLDAALASAPDYVAYGPVFTTASKRNPDPVVGVAGAAGLAEAARKARAARIPLVAIGGITLENLSTIVAAADMVALISALVPEPFGSAQVSERVRQFQRALRRD